MQLGVIADDITGATDVAVTLARGGARVVQTIGVPEGPLEGVDAAVVALKSRTIPAAEAVEMSLAAARALRAAGASRLMFKYCSTFDSRDEGNIGPVTEALMREAGADVVLTTPAYPRNARFVFQGHLFVGATLLSESPMKDHPLTPMRDSNLVRVLGRQTALPVGLVSFADLAGGEDGVRRAISRERDAGRRMLIVDGVRDEDLRAAGRVARGMPLVAGGAGIAIDLVDASGAAAPPFPAPTGPALVLAGSCSVATQAQVATALAAGLPARKLDPDALADGRETADGIADWARAQLGERPVLLYSTPDPAELKAVQARHGAERIGALIEHTLASAAASLVDAGVERVLVAGGETSGAVAAALGVKRLAIGPEIDAGVPWCAALDRPPLVLAAKSGNFGAPDIFLKAWDVLRR